MPDFKVGGAYVELYTTGKEEVKKELTELDKQYKEYEKELAKVAKKISDTYKKLNDAHAAMALKNSTSKTLEAQLKQLKEQHQAEDKQFAITIKELQLQIKKLNEAKKAAAGGQVNEIAAIRAEITKLEEARNNARKRNLNDVKALTAELNEVKSVSKNEADILKIENLKKQLQELKTYQAELKARISETSDAMMELNGKTEMPKNLAESIQETSEALDLDNTSINKFGDNVDKISKKLKKYAEELKTLESKKKQLIVKIDEATVKYGKNSKTVKELEKQLSELTDEQEKLKKKFKNTTNSLDEQIKGYGKLADAAKHMQTSFNAVSGAATLFKAAITSIAAKELFHWLIDENSQIEQYLTSFNILLGDIDAAQSIMDDIVEVAKFTPFETDDVVKAVELIAQYGEAQENLIPTFNKLANLSRGNAQNLDAIAEAYGRIKNAGKVTLRELNMMIRRSVPIMQALSDTTGHSVGEIYKLIRAGKLGVDELDNAINYLTTDGGKFENLIKEQGKTLQGRISTLKDYIKFAGKDIGEETFENLKVYIEEIILEFERLEAEGALDKFVSQFGEDIALVVEKFADLIRFIYEYKDSVATLVGGILAFTKASQLANSAIKAFGIELKGANLSKFNIVLAALTASISLATKEIIKMSIEEEKLVGKTRDLIKSSQNLTKKYMNEMTSIKSTTSEAQKLTSQLSILMSATEQSAKQHKDIEGIVARLNDLYPDLNLQYDAERNELSKNITTIDDYIDGLDRLYKLQANEELYKGAIVKDTELKAERERIEEELNAEIQRQQEINKLRDEWQGDWANQGLVKGWNLAEIDAESERNLVALTKEWENLNVEIEKNDKVLNNYRDTLEEQKQAQEQVNGALENNENTYKIISDEISKATTQLNNAHDALNDKSSDFSESVDNAIDSVDDLTDAMVKNSSETSFSSDEILRLLENYPELADAIYVTADGYKIETEALNILRQAKIDEAKAAINSQLKTTRSTIDNINERILARQAEGKSVAELMMQMAELEKNAASYEKALEIYNRKLDVAISPSGRSTKSSKKETEEYDEKLIRNLKFQYDMGIIDAKKYYDELEKIKNKYYADGSKKWQQYTLEVKNGREKIEEEMRKAAEAEFKGTIEDMRQNIDDEEFYDRLSKEQKITSLKEIRNYILDSYEQRRIDYENFAEQLRLIDRDIYAEEKEMLEVNIEELNKLRDKKYDEAVKKIEDYYDAIFAAQRAAEREQEMRELQETAALYEGAVSRAGQEKLKELQKDIQALEKEKIQEELENQREYHLENLDAKYKALEESQNEYFNTIQGGIKTTAEIVEEYTRQINEFFSQINSVLLTSRGYEGVSNQNLTINQNIYDSASNRAAIDMTKIVSNYGFK